MPEVGLEPTRGCPHRILNPARLPISSLRLHSEWATNIPYQPLIWDNFPQVHPSTPTGHEFQGCNIKGARKLKQNITETAQGDRQ